VRFRAPAIVHLRRAQIILILAALVPTILMTFLGIVLLAVGSAVSIVVGVLVLAFCTSAVTGYILGSIFVSRGASLARVQSDFLSSVSHELRTPLTSMRVFVETLRDERVTDPNEKRQCLDILHGEMNRFEGLVNRLIELSRIESGRHAFKQEPVPVRGVVDDAMAVFRAATLGKETPVAMAIEADLLVMGDREALAQALGNLLINAWKYTGDHKDIRLSAVARSQKEVEIAVADNGPGVPRDEQDKIFEKFERGRAAVDSRQPGSGLGLSVVKAIVVAHRGRVQVSSESSSGARFSMLLRRVNVPAPAP
jgi:two-component system phosphate regulon sensor histidine kinase PhoR